MRRIELPETPGDNTRYVPVHPTSQRLIVLIRDGRRRRLRLASGRHLEGPGTLTASTTAAGRNLMPEGRAPTDMPACHDPRHGR